MSTPLIVVISGISGAGKNSVIELLRQMPEQFAFFVTCTTRKIRPGEVEGREYHFISDEEFDFLIENGGFIEWENVHDKRYGTRKSDLEELLKGDKTIITTLDVKGAMNIKKMYPNVLTVFIEPPSLEEAIRRLGLRGTEDPEKVELRQKRYEMELSYRDKYDATIINDDLATAQRELLDLIEKRR